MTAAQTVVDGVPEVRGSPNNDNSDNDESDSSDDILERVQQDLRQLTLVEGPIIADLDSLEVENDTVTLESDVDENMKIDITPGSVAKSNDSFFDYEALEESDESVEIEPVIRRLQYNGRVDDAHIPNHIDEESDDTDSDMGHLIADASDEGGARAPTSVSPSRRAERFREKVESCKRVRVKKTVRKIEQSRLDGFAPSWSGWRRLMSDQMCMEWTRSMSRTGHSVRDVLESEVPSQEEIIDPLSPTCGDEDIDTPLAKRQKLGRDIVRPVSEFEQYIDENGWIACRPRRSRGRECNVVASSKRSTPARVIGGRRIRLARGITVDSGAADNVLPRRLLRGKSKVRPSQASRDGVHYVAANGGRIPNEGEADFPFCTREGQSFSWLFQVAEVNKILASVSALVDTGHRVSFDTDDVTGVDCLFITCKKSGESIKMRRDRNVWVIDAFVDESGNDVQINSTEQDFRRQE